MVDHYNIIYNLKNSCDDNCVDSKNFVFSYFFLIFFLATTMERLVMLTMMMAVMDNDKTRQHSN